MTSPVVTRFAPSPTGFLHIGGARTALFNWLFARHHNGKMLLRIEDTDRQRSTQGAIDAILDGLRWLGLDWEGEPFFQHQHLERHADIAQLLLDSGKAYKCYCTSEELEKMREAAREAGRAASYDGTWRDRDASEAPEGIKPVIRFRSPENGVTTVEDHVQGSVTVSNSELDDLIILRSDGTPTYNLSVVVDDHDMGVTHVIRGDDHLTNAARQSQIYEALDWPVPVFAHIPLIHGSDGAKLSKRHGALGVEAYRDMGYLPPALRNYLVRLGWSHGDEEIISTEQMVEWFGLEAIGKSPARFDFDKLNNLNAHYLRATEDETLVSELKQFWQTSDAFSDLHDKLNPERTDQLQLALAPLKERAKTLIDLSEGASFVFAERPLTLEDGAAKFIDEEARRTLAALCPELEALGKWSLATVEAAIRSFTEQQGLKLGKVAQPLRAALTGTTKSPGIFDVLNILGREETLDRIRDQL